MTRLTNKELSGLAYNKVKEMILANQLKPGQKIVQDKLALELGISRTPLRSALQMLEAEYLVKSIPRRGVVVRSFSDDKIVEVYDCRIALESIAVRRFTERATALQIERLREFFNPFIYTDADINIKDYQAEDVKFHDHIIQCCGNDFLAKLYQQSNLLICINQIGLVRPSEETLPEHLDIIEAIESQDADRAEELSRMHLQKSKELVIQKIKNSTKRLAHYPKALP